MRETFPIAVFLLLAALAFPRLSFGAPLNGKTAAYFADRYGPSKSVTTVSKYSFVHPKRGGVTVKSQFSVREFRKDDLIVYPVFFLPSLQLAAVRLQLQRQWTKEQIQAALSAYGGEWKPITRNGIVDTWVAPDGSMAIAMLTWLDIQSKAIVDLTAKTLAENDAKQKAVPKL